MAKSYDPSQTLPMTGPHSAALPQSRKRYTGKDSIQEPGRYTTIQQQSFQASNQQSIINLDIEVPTHQKKNNKNDFYRYLLQQNYGTGGSEQPKANNDVLIPRSILKRNNPGNLVKDRRLEEATQEYYRYQEDLAQQKLNRTESEEDTIGKYDALFGRQLMAGNPLLSPKMKQVVRAAI